MLAGDTTRSELKQNPLARIPRPFACVELARLPDIVPTTQLRAVTRPLSELTLHPAWQRNHIPLPAGPRSDGVSRPICITPGGVVVAGFEAFAQLRQGGPEMIDCLLYNVKEEDGLRLILQNCRAINGLNKYCRVVLALEELPALCERAKLNQKRRGNSLAILPDLQAIDCREEIGKLAGVGGRTVAKVSELHRNAPPEALDALRTGEVSIDAAYKWLKLPTDHRESFQDYLVGRDLEAQVRQLERARHRHTPISREKLMRIGELSRKLASSGRETFLPAEITQIFLFNEVHDGGSGA